MSSRAMEKLARASKRANVRSSATDFVTIAGGTAAGIALSNEYESLRNRSEPKPDAPDAPPQPVTEKSEDRRKSASPSKPKGSKPSSSSSKSNSTSSKESSH